MVLRGWFDESIRTGAGDPIAVAGYLFKPTKYKQFVRRWDRTILRRGNRVFTAFHMTDVFAGEREFTGLSITERAELFREAALIINDHMTAGIGVSILQTEFE